MTHVGLDGILQAQQAMVAVIVVDNHWPVAFIFASLERSKVLHIAFRFYVMKLKPSS